MQDRATTRAARPADAASGAHAVAGDRLGDWLDLLHDLYPPAHAEGWDAVGLHVGDPDGDAVTGVLVSLDVTAAVIDEAADHACDLLVAHHPLLFRPLVRLTPATAAGRLALAAARRGVAVAAAHTNLDKAADGTSHPAAAVLQLTAAEPLEPLPPDPQLKLVTFVPREATAAVQSALAAAGAGVIGDYDACGFRASGIGTFRPGPGAQPHIGVRGELAEVEEDRVEVVLPAASRAGVLTALRDAHPYEEVPVDLYPLVPAGPTRLGLGVVGDLPEPTSLAALVRRLREGLDVAGVRLAAGPDHDDPDADPADRLVTRVAVVGGAGTSLADAARRAGAQVLVTGDVTHHHALDAVTQGLAVIDAGHWGTEWPAMSALARHLADGARFRGLAAPVRLARTRTDPWIDWTQP